MRSDFLGDCASFYGLPEAINNGLFLIPRLTREQLREAIENPAAVFGVRILPELTNQLLNDIGTNPDQLSILQHALMRMWDINPVVQAWFNDIRRGERSIDTDIHSGPYLIKKDYEKIGTVGDALSDHANEVYNSLNPNQQRIAEVLFRALTERGSASRDTRRPIQLGEAAELAGVNWEEVATVADIFRVTGRNFLMPPPEVPLNADTVLDITHESLIRQWKHLQQWVKEEGESADIYRRLESAAVRWQDGKGSLWRGPELNSALRWQVEQKPSALWAKRYTALTSDPTRGYNLSLQFLERSKQQQEAERKAQAKVRVEKLRLVVGGVLLIFILLGVLGWFSFHNAQKAVNTLARQLSAKMSARILERAKEYLAVPHLINRLDANAIQLGLLDILDPEERLKFFWKQVQTFDLSSHNYMGTPNGHYFGGAFPKYDNP